MTAQFDACPPSSGHVSDVRATASTEVAIDLVPEGNATLVRLTHTGFVDEEEAAKHAEGWMYWLERLNALGEGKDPGEDRSIQALLHASPQ